MGGEKSISAPSWGPGTGSPPRGRGKGPHLEKTAVRGGITPAWAGKSLHFSHFLGGGKDHPRVGGEKVVLLLLALQLMGSPPRGRGKAVALKARIAKIRITPAWAGKSTVSSAWTGSNEDHPRVGGEKLAVPDCYSLCSGSPPRGRGKVVVPRNLCLFSGITPAWAGKRLKRSHRSGIFISGPIPFHSVLHRPAGSGGSRAGRDGSPAGQPQNAGPA